MAAAGDTLFAHLDALFDLPAGERRAALAALDVDSATRAELEALLEADDSGDTRLARAVEGGAQRLAALPPGLRLGPLRVLREIGAGGMGTVFLGERADGAFGQQVAIKVLRGFPTADGMRRLRQERRILAELDHPNIARLLDGGETPEGQPYLVMEYVDGVPLADWLRTAAPETTTRIALFDKLAAAVAHAHRHLVIHRDLKPGNVIVRADGEPKLLDFGVARLASLDSGEASTRVASMGWASPEQAAGGAVTTASDVYSLGVILRVLLGGRDDRDPEAPAPLADAELRGAIAMATAADPAHRYPGVDALREDLLAWRERRPLRALPDTTRYRLAKFIARHRPGAVLMLAAIAAGLAFTWRLAIERDRAVAAERLAAANLQRASLTQRFLSGTLLGAGTRDAEGQPISGVALIESAAQSLERDLGDDPRALSEVAAVVSQAWMNALDFERAVEAARLAVARTPADERPLVLASRMRLLARNLRSLDQLDEAAAVVRDALALLPEMPADREHAEVGTQLRVTLAQATRRHDPRWRAVHEDLLRHARAHLPEGHSLRGMAATLWALVLEVEDRVAELPDARREALAEWAADPAAFPTDLAYQELNLARAYRLAGRLGEAAAAANAAEARFAAVLGERMIAGRAMVLGEQAEIALARGDLAAARAAFARFSPLVPQLGLGDEYVLHRVSAALLEADGRLDEARVAAGHASTLAASPAQRRDAQALLDRLAPRR